jgi:hypothetical protein
MTPGPRDIAQIRLANAMALFDEFVHANVKNADAATLRGLEGRFADRLQIQPSYWSQIKSRSRHIGERLARQFEHLCHKPSGWMDDLHGPTAPRPRNPAPREPKRAEPHGAETRESEPQDDDERFIVGLVLTYYRRHPQRARTRLLGLLGEVLAPAPSTSSSASARNGVKSGLASAAAADDGADLWQRTQAAVAPLKRKR